MNAMASGVTLSAASTRSPSFSRSSSSTRISILPARICSMPRVTREISSESRSWRRAGSIDMKGGRRLFVPSALERKGKTLVRGWGGGLSGRFEVIDQVAGDQIRFQVQLGPGPPVLEAGHLPGVRNQHDRQLEPRDGVDGERNAVERD